MKNTRQVQVFLAEDNVADVWLVEEALKRQSLDYHLDHYSTAEDAINAAKACGFADALIPDLMLVDFNLPRGDGRDVLAAAASNPKLADVPKVVMSSFLRQEEMDQAIQLGARCFIPKPTGLDAFLTTVGTKVTELLRTTAEEVERS
jgi:chemotaxis family two-component system response regulator Rcp1